MGYGLQGPMGGPTGRGLNASTGPKKFGGFDVKQFQNYTPQQMQLFEQQFQHVGPESFLSRLAGGDESIFNQIEAPAHRDLSSALGGIASRFSQGGGSPGSMSSRRSSGFQNTATAAASNFAQNLQSQRQSLQQNALRELMSMSGDLLNQRPYENYLQEKKPSFLQQLLGAGLPIAGAAAGGFFGGPAGASLGGQIGSAASKGFFA